MHVNIMFELYLKFSGDILVVPLKHFCSFLAFIEFQPANEKHRPRHRWAVSASCLERQSAWNRVKDSQHTSEIK